MELGTLGTAGIGAALLAFWHQIQTWGSKFMNLFVVSVSLTHNAASEEPYIFRQYLRENFRELKIKDTIEIIWVNRYLTKSRKYKSVPADNGSAQSTWLKGWRPLFVSQGEKGIQFQYIRGTFALEDILRGMDSYSADQIIEANIEADSRFVVHRVHGSRNRTGQEGVQLSDSSPPSSSSWYNMRYFIHDISDFSTPGADDPFESLAYSEEPYLLLQDIDYWKKSQNWYRDKLISWRIGAVLFGLPGTGKSSFVSAMAKKYNMPVYSFDLTTFSNKDLQDEWKRAVRNSPCVVLFEDMDRIFDDNKAIINQITGPQLTLDAILNCIQGVENSEGVCVIATANDISRLPEALGVADASGKSTRPGRFDRAVYFGPLEREQRLKIAGKILSEMPDSIQEVVDATEGYTGAQFIKHCGDLALADHWARKDKKLLTLVKTGTGE